MMDLLGWQPGIPDDSAIWDEEWDKFEDEGIQVVLDKLFNSLHLQCCSFWSQFIVSKL